MAHYEIKSLHDSKKSQVNETLPREGLVNDGMLF